MKIQFYIVTYKNHLGLKECLESLAKTAIPEGIFLMINIINNHSDFILPDEFANVRVLHNTLRPNWSSGHLARSWNQALLHGFGNLKHPANNIVAMCQVDTIFDGSWLERLVELHKTYNFVTAGHGDAFMSFAAEGVRKIGLFDERFCNIVHQETDYFTRALIFNRDCSSINDFHHGKILNPFLAENNDNSFVYRKNSNTTVTWTATTECHEYITKFLMSKYSRNPMLWDTNNAPHLIKKLILLYPYFEFDVTDFASKYDIY